MTHTNSPARFSGFPGWLRHALANISFLYRVNINRRLTLCFIFVIVLMLVGNGVLLWEFHLIRAQVERLNGVNEELIEVLRVHTGLLSVYDRLGVLARSEDSARLLKESTTLRKGLLDDAQRTLATFNHLPPEMKVDQTVLPTLESIERTLPSHLDAITSAAASGEWDAVRFRIERQVQPLESLSSELVKDVTREVEDQRAQAAQNISRAENRIFLAVPITGFVTLLIAAGLGVAITRSVTEPLGRLIEGSKALARGEFEHQISVIGADELAHLGLVFNDTARTLRDLYEDLRGREEKLRRSEASLLEGQRLTHTGNWRHDISSGKMTTSPEMHRIYGVTPDEDATTADFFFNRLHPEERSFLEQKYEKTKQSKTSFESDYRIVLPDGSIKYIHNIGHPILNESNVIVEFAGTAMDVTEQRLARADLEKAFEEIKLLKDRLHDENLVLREQIDQAFLFEEIVGSSPALQTVLSSIVKVAPTDSTVLITGETGTGKELIARAIHKHSQRSGEAFISVNCASIPSSLIASELFGHEKGAFTGAIQRRQGRFELAHSGTIFLDEVGELPAETQIALLRVLQERQFERVGGTRVFSTDVRVIAATNRDLTAAIAAGTFRADLFYRLNVFPIEVPPLRKRKEDIPMLVEYFVKRYAEKAGKHIRKIDMNTLEMCQSYPWPGNIRELQNIIERSVILSNGDTFWIEHAWLASPKQDRQELPSPLPDTLQNQEREMIEAALAECKGKVAGPKGAAAKLGIPRSTLDSKINQLKIKKHKFVSD
jgi:transcriptional regulator with PAS, ATPase and Fis domain/HAMP domain-containing protein